MNDVSLWQNEIQFPVKNIWDSLNIFYISDIDVYKRQVKSRLHKAREKMKEELEAAGYDR